MTVNQEEVSTPTVREGAGPSRASERQPQVLTTND
jgi:hypothetical protein